MAKQDQQEKQATVKGIEQQSGIASGWRFVSFIQRHRYYITFAFILAIIYISYRIHAERTIVKAQRLEAELEVRHVEYTIKSEELIKLYKRSEIIKQIQQKGLGLIESKEPPKRIRAN